MVWINALNTGQARSLNEAGGDATPEIVSAGDAAAEIVGSLARSAERRPRRPAGEEEALTFQGDRGMFRSTGRPCTVPQADVEMEP
jgi:hypothetical protein